MKEEFEESELTEKIINAAIEVHKTIGPGLKEEVYKRALKIELEMRGIKAKAEDPVVVKYKGVVINDSGHPKRIDLLVENSVVVECKAVAEAKDPIFRAQCLTYVRMKGLRVGLVLNFGRPTLKEGIERIINEEKDVYLSRMAKRNPATFRNILREERPGLTDTQLHDLEESYKRK